MTWSLRVAHTRKDIGRTAALEPSQTTPPGLVSSDPKRNIIYSQKKQVMTLFGLT